MSLSDSKSALRKELRARRRSRDLSQPALEQQISALRAHLTRLTAGLHAGDQYVEEASGGSAVLAVFAPTQLEPPALHAFEDAAFAGFTLIMPVYNPSEPEFLDWAIWDGDSPLQPSPGTGFGLEPDGPRLGKDALRHADVILAPALAVDISGTRLGQGGGFYDRALTWRHPDAPIFALVHPEEVFPAHALPGDVHDQRVDGILTWQGVTLCEHDVPAGDPLE